MADPRSCLARVPQPVGRRVSSLLADDASTVFDSELTADTSPSRYVHSHDGGDETTTGQYEAYARITGFGVDYTNIDDVSFPGFRPMRHHGLTREAARYLVSEHRWCNEGDSADIVGQKNVILIFVCIATIEDCLVDEESGKMLPVIKRQFEALMDLLGVGHHPDGSRRNYMFLRAIRNAFVSSRIAEINFHLENGGGSPPEPNDLPGLGRMLLDVIDRHIAFLRTKKPLNSHRKPIPLEERFKLRLDQIKNQLRNREGVEECFKLFVPTIPVHEQTSWPRAGMATSWASARAKLIAEQSELAVDSNSGKRPEYQEVLRDRHDSFGAKPDFHIPGIPADGPERSLQSAPNSPARRSDTWNPDALFGLKVFKTAVRQVHRVIRSSRDSMNFRSFIGQIEHDVEQYRTEMQVGLTLPLDAPPGATGVLGAEIDEHMEREKIRSLMKVGLGLIRRQWNEKHLANDMRGKILVEIQEELRIIGDAADKVCSGEA